MKMLILLLSLYSLSASATVTELSDEEIHKHHMSVIKDTQVEGQLLQNDVFNDCRKKNEFKESDTQQDKDKKVQDATKCFSDNLPKDADSLKKISDSLDLQSYGLVSGKDSRSVISYLTNKISKSLTGVDPNEKNQAKQIEDLKFGRSKIVDQRVFLDLYTNQLVKSALLEVSRFCFENLERTGVDRKGQNLEDYWTNNMKMQNKKDPTTGKLVLDKDGKPVQEANLSGLTDTGTPLNSYLDTASIKDLTKKQDNYDAMMKGIAKNQVKPQFHKDFFAFCQSTIKPLCDQYRQSITPSSTPGQETSVAVARNSNSFSTSSSMKNGQNSCLTLEKLTSIRGALKKSELVGKQFDEMGEKKGDFALSMLNKPQIYQRGKGQSEESLDAISNMSSSDIINSESESGNFAEIKTLEQKCSNSPTDPECDQFLIKSDNLDKAISKIENEMNLKREIELARAKELKKDQKSLIEYLEDQGLFDLSAQVKANGVNSIDIEKELKKVYEAKKMAEIDAIKSKIGKRQISEKALSDLEAQDPNKKASLIQENVKDVKTEKIRMAQVIMFNNIITSTLDLYDMDGKTTIGRNVGGWKKEFDGLQKDGVDTTLFQGIQAEADKNAGKTDDTSIAGSGIIDSILGKIGD